MMDAQAQAPAPKKPGRRPKKAKAPKPDKPALPAVIANDEKPPVEKDERGWFAPGNNGGPGRPLGAKNKLTEDFIEDFHAAWLEGGPKALRYVMENEPAKFI